MWRCYINTIIDFSDIVHRPVLYLKNNDDVSPISTPIFEMELRIQQLHPV
jgi:hypothetical protein